MMPGVRDRRALSHPAAAVGAFGIVSLALLGAARPAHGQGNCVADRSPRSFSLDWNDGHTSVDALTSYIAPDDTLTWNWDHTVRAPADAGTNVRALRLFRNTGGTQPATVGSFRVMG